MSQTIFVDHKPNTYKAHKTIGGWVVMFLDKDGNSRNADGGKIYSHRQNAYARVKRLNHPIKYAIKKHGMCEAYFDGYTAGVELLDDGKYKLWIQSGGMPPHYSATFNSVEEVEEEMRERTFFPATVAWSPIKPEEQ